MALVRVFLFPFRMVAYAAGFILFLAVSIALVPVVFVGLWVTLAVALVMSVASALRGQGLAYGFEETLDAAQAFRRGSD
jgi:hypothetical protein